MTNNNDIDIIDRILILNLFDISEDKKTEDKKLNNKQNTNLLWTRNRYDYYKR